MYFKHKRGKLIVCIKLLMDIVSKLMEEENNSKKNFRYLSGNLH